MKKISSKVRGFDTKKDKIVIANDEEPQQHLQDELIDMPRRSPRNTGTLVSTVPTPGFGTVKIDHTPQPRGALARMQEKGLRITNYSETDGAGRPLNRRRDEDDDE